MEIEKPTRVKRKINQIQPITSVNQIESKTRSKLFMDACNLARQGHYEKAKTLFLDIDTNCQEYGRAQYLLGCACNKLDEYKQAISAFTKAVQNLKEMIPVELFYQEGIAHWKLGAYEEAIKSFSRFIRETEEENAHNGYLSRALVYGSMDHYEKALSDLNKANEHEEHRTTYSLCCRGRIFAHLGQYENAKKDFQAASRINPQDFQSHLQLGIIYSELGQYSQALKEFDRALQYSSNDNKDRAEICFRQALVYHSLKDFDAAIEKLVETVHRNPKHARACFRLGRAYIVAGNYSKALEVLNTAHTLAPHDKDIIYELSILHERVDRSKLALYEKRRAFGLQQLEPSREETSDPEKQIVDDGPTSSQPTSLPPSVEARRYVNLHLKSAIEQEELLPMAVNHLASYYKILEEYKLAFDSGECPEAQAFLALCQEAQQDFVDANDSMNKLYDELQNNPNAYRLWRDNLNELKKDKELGRLAAHRYFVMERIQSNISDIQKDHEEFKNDPSENRKHFYDTLRRRLNQSLVAFSVTGCGTSIVAHNLEGSISKVAWIIKYLGKALNFVPEFGSALGLGLETISSLLYTKDYNRVQDKLSLISGMGDHTEFFSVSRLVAREIAYRYKTQLLRLADDHIKLSDASKAATTIRGYIYEQEDTNIPANRVANFAIKYVIETIRDQKLEKLGFSRKPKTQINDLPNILIKMICSSEANIPRRYFSCTKVDVNRHLATTSETPNNHWILYEFFRAPGIELEDSKSESDGILGNNVNKVLQYHEAQWMNPKLYGYRIGTQEEIDTIKKKLEDVETKKFFFRRR